MSGKQLQPFEESRIPPTGGWGQKEDTRIVSEECGEESGRGQRQCVKNSRGSPLGADVVIQAWQTIHFVVRTLSPVKRRRKFLHEPFYSRPKGQVRKPPPSPPCLLCPPLTAPSPGLTLIHEEHCDYAQKRQEQPGVHS